MNSKALPFPPLGFSFAFCHLFYFFFLTFPPPQLSSFKIARLSCHLFPRFLLEGEVVVSGGHVTAPCPANYFCTRHTQSIESALDDIITPRPASNHCKSGPLILPLSGF